MNELHLFAGAGGGILGGILCGHTTVCAVEWDKHARQVLLARPRDGCLPRFPIWDDIQTFDGKPWRGRVDVVCGGFPCQDISIAGKGAGIEGERSGMWSHMARIIGEVRPRFVFVENSPMLVGRGLAVVLGDLAKMGYDARWGIVGADDAGAPHQRKRIWILAYAKMPDDAPGPGASRPDQWSQVQLGRSCRRENMAHAAQLFGDGSEHHAGISMGGPLSESGNSSGAQDMADTNGAQCEGVRCASLGASQRADTYTPGAWWRQDPAEQAKSGVGRVVNGVAFGMERLKRIGNGQVPTVAHLAWEILSK